jgi:uncharacterized tellurite resistance protein B-like protein
MSPLLDGHTPAEKTAYITAIASIATADNSASEEEISYLMDLADHAGLSDADKQVVETAAKDTTDSALRQSLDTLKSSELRFSLVADLIAFAESDNNLAPEEKEHIAGVADYLGIDKSQLEALSDFVKQSATQPATEMAAAGSASSGPEGLLDRLGIGDKLKGAGINLGSLTKGLMSFVGPMVIGNLISKGLSRNKGTATSTAGFGGIGNLLGGLTGGRGLSGVGGFLSNLLKR